MFPEASRQADNVLPPRQGNVLVITVDSTSRQYDLWSIKFGSDTANVGNRQDHFYVTLQAEGCDVYWSTTADGATTGVAIDDTVAVAAGGALAFANTHVARIVKDTEKDVRFHRSLDRYLNLKAASGASGKLRIYVSSQLNASTS